jgi:aminoglycoside phosphotransferase (APT) family kinase protein
MVTRQKDQAGFRGFRMRGVQTTNGAMTPLASTALMSADASAGLVDWNRVGAYLALSGLHLDRSFVPRRFAGGLANINMLIRVDDMWAVFRRPPAGPLPKGAHDMAREHRVLSRLWRQLPIAPKSLHFCEDVTLVGAAFQILAFYEGRVVRGADIAPLPDTPDTGTAVSTMLIETLARIHAVDVESAGLSDLGRPQGFLARTAKGWTARGEAMSPGGISPACAAVGDWLQRQDPVECDLPTLLHNDFKLDNIILAPDAISPVAVVDWDMATRGDPLFDLATLLSYWTEPGDPSCMRALNQMPTGRAGFMTREAAAQAYADLAGRSLDGFLFPRVLAMFKLGVVFQQLHAQPTGDGRPDPRLAGIVPDALFEFALDVAHGKIF